MEHIHAVLEGNKKATIAQIATSLDTSLKNYSPTDTGASRFGCVIGEFGRVDHMILWQIDHQQTITGHSHKLIRK